MHRLLLGALLLLAARETFAYQPWMGTAARCAARACLPASRMLAKPSSSSSNENFFIRVDLGEGGIFDEEVEPFFSDSVLLTVRFQLPFSLRAEPSQGVMRVVADGDGLRVGDVLRLCQTYQMRMDVSNSVLPQIGARPAKCLFVADGQPPDRVLEALTANTEDRTSDVVMVFERPFDKETAARHARYNSY